jgi:hypothetical protein
MVSTEQPSIVDEMRILTPGLSPEEIAAVTAVVALTVEELADEQTPEFDPAPARWRSGLGAMRGDLATTRGSWGHSLR